MDFLSFLQRNIPLFDGAFGTMLQQRAGGPVGTVPELWNVERPADVAAIHRAYAEAGADVITANTFGANEFKVGSAEEAEKLIRAGVRLAKEAAPEKFVALDIGPSGRLLEPMGSLSFDDAYAAFARQAKAGAAAGADLILVETMADLQELRAAVLAARENTSLPVLCSMTFEENGRTFAGCDPVCYALTASPLADAIGVNCSLGPDKLLPVVQALLDHTNKPVLVQANAGLPDEQMNYSVGPEEFAAAYRAFLDAGVRILGGCCGTTPEHIRRLRALIGRRRPRAARRKFISAVCSATKAVFFDGVRTIGERINPTGKKAMKQALREGDYAFVQGQAIEQAEAGADILDVNAGLPEIDEKAALVRLVREVQAVCDLPLQIDCGKPDAVEAALRRYCGKAIVNSVNGDPAVLRTILPIVKKYGAAVVGLTTDERGIPRTAAERVRIAGDIIHACAEYGIPQENILIDCLTLTVSAEQGQARETLEAIRQIKSRWRVRTTLGVSNISFGLPERRIVNTVFLTAAFAAGLDAPILNPNIPENMQAVHAWRVLSGEDKNCAAYTARYGGVKTAAAPANTANGITADAAGAANATDAAGAANATDAAGSKTADARAELFRCIRRGLPQAAAACAALLEREAPLDVVNGSLIPALNEVGDDYEKGVLFLPQLIAAAESAKLCFDEVKKRLPGGETERGKIVLATVKGDIHDIGKNIARTVLENYGYKVIDLGKNVPPEQVAAACEREDVRLCGLSALMTTTVPAMEETIRLLRARCPRCRVMVGGAVLNADYAKKIGADWYCKDANADVKIARYLFEGGEEVPTL